MTRPIAISLSPNVNRDDVFLAAKLLFSPWKYTNGTSVMLLEQWFRTYFNSSHAVSFATGRGALFAILKSLGVGKGDEVILQSFTCVVVPNAILSVSAKPVYVDINETTTMDTLHLAEKITKKTKAIIVQHTFGIPANMEKIMAIAKKHNVYVIEDCAHTIGGTYKGKKLGTFGIASFFSLGRDKAASSVFGGVALTHDKIIGKKLRLFERARPDPSSVWIFQQLLHPVAFAIILPLYDVLYLGKILLIVLQKLHLLSFPVMQGEKKGKFLPFAVCKMPNALATLATFQVRKINEFNAKRQRIAKVYIDQLPKKQITAVCKNTVPLLRFPITVERDRDKCVAYAKKKGIYLGIWYSTGMDPVGTDHEKVGYDIHEFPKTKDIGKRIVNLPTYPAMNEKDVQKVVETLLTFYGN